MAIKKQRKKYVFGIVALILVVGAGLYFLLANEVVQSTKTVYQYGKEEKQDLKLYNIKEQKTTKKMPVILYAHGGGWTAGDKSNIVDKPAYFNDLGYNFISMNYRLSPEVTYKEQTEDVVHALKWVIDHADTYGYDVNKITLVGHSAGGHLMMLAATDERYLKEAGLSKKNIHSLISIEGPLDLTAFITNFSDFKKVYGNDKRVWEDASPSEFIKGNKQPPTLIITHLDEVTNTFMRNSQAAGNDVQLFSANELSHSELTKLIGNKQPQEAQALTAKITAFLREYE